MTVRPDGPDYTLYKNAIRKIVFASGKVIFYKHRYFENSIGITGSYYNNPSHVYRMLFTYMNISCKYPGLNYQVRNAIVGLKIGLGYGQLNKITEKTISYGVHHNTIYKNVFDTIDTGKLHLIFSFRINGTANRKINPFISASIIIQDISIIHLFGFGCQYRINKKYFIEAEIAIGKWHGDDDPEYYDYGSELTYFNIGINRILSLKYKNGK